MADGIEERLANASEEHKKRKLSGKAIAAIICVALAAVLCITTIFTRSADTLMLALILLVPAIILLFIIAHGKMKKRLHLRSFWPYWGIIAETMCVPLFLLGGEISFVSSLFGFIILLTSIFCPVFGIVAGSVALTQERANCSTGGFVTAIIDVALPPLAVIILIVLLSQGVIVITFM